MFAAVVTSGTAASGQANRPVITSITPPSVTRGTSELVDIAGEGLDGASFFVAGPGLTVGPPRAIATGLTRVRITASAAAAVGPHELRAVSIRGASVPVPLWVGVFPQRPEAEPNDTFDRAEQLPGTPLSICGAIDHPGDQDVYAFHGRAGEHWVVDCAVTAIESPLVPTVDVTGPDDIAALARDTSRRVGTAIGLNTLSTTQANYYRGACTDVELHKDGVYHILVEGRGGDGGREFRYMLTAGRVPLVQRFSPHGEKPGRTVGLEIEGVNLGGTRRATIRTPELPPPLFWCSVKTANGPTLPFVFPTTDVPTIAVTETDQVMPLPAVPGAIEGKFEAYPVARFFYDARARERLRFDLQSESLGSDARAVLKITDDRGNTVAGSGRPGDDPWSAAVAPDRDMRYTIEIRNAKEARGLSAFYRLVVDEDQPDFLARIPTDSVTARAGDVVQMPIAIERRGGFGGAVEVTAASLPKGVTSARLTVPSGQVTGEFRLRLDRSVPALPFLLQLRARGVANGRPLSKPIPAIFGKDAGQERTALFPVIVLPAAPLSAGKK